MAKIQLITCHPARFMGGRRIEAAHYRAEQFLEPLLSDGHEILLCAGARDEEPSTIPVPDSGATNLHYRHIPFGRRGWVLSLQESHDRFQPDCVIAINYSHCLYTTRLKTDRPVWMDIYGDMITIQQAYCYRVRANRGMPTTVQFMRDILQSGDIFSVCGEPQRHMLVGELAMTGRLNHQSFGYEFTRVILPGSPELPPQPQDQRRPGAPGKLGLAPDDFVVLWCGGYNTWTDVDTLFQALEWAMARDPKLHYVSVGDSTYSSPETAYTRLLSLIERSRYRGRYHMQGWQPWQDIPEYYRESHVGLNIDAMHYETVYGTRTRLVEMIAAGLPVITTEGTELSYLLRQAGAALTFEVGRPDQLASQLLRMGREEGLREAMSGAALRSARSLFSFATTTQPLRSWVESPVLSPDRRPASRTRRIEQARNRARALVRGLIWKLVAMEK